MQRITRLTYVLQKTTYLTLKAPTPHNGKTHSNNSSANCVFDYFVGLVFKRVEKCRASNILIKRLPINPLSASIALI